MYRSPSLNHEQNNILLTSLSNICTVDSDYETVLVGDFNLPDVSWTTGVVRSPPDTNNKILNVQKQFVDVFHNNGLVWLLKNDITRSRLINGVLQESLLDQVLTTNDAVFDEYKILSPLGKSDHVSINIVLNIPKIHRNIVFERKNKKCWSKIDVDELMDLSHDIDWQYSCDNLNSEQMWDELCGKLDSISENVPTAKCFDNSTQNYNMPWSTSALKRLRKEKDKMWLLFDFKPTPQNLNIALEAQNKYEKKEIAAKVKYEHKITQNLKNNCKPFFRI